MIRMTHVSKQFANKKVLHQLDLEIAKGCVYGLVGPNGSGKSTILRLLCGVYSLNEGMLMIEDQPVYDNVNMKKRIFFVSDEPYFLPQATLKDMKQFYQLFYPNFSLEVYASLLKVFPIHEKTKMNTMSKGMKQQAILILALASQVDYLLLDEAFDGLDPVMRFALKRIIADEIQNRGATVIISSHNLRELEDICDTLGLLNNGSISISGNVEQLKSRLCKLQIGVMEELPSDIWQDMDILHTSQVGKVITLVTHQTAQEIQDTLQPYKVALFEQMPVTLEEVFVYEMEAQGYGSVE